jgi:hypothetical protein
MLLSFAKKLRTTLQPGSTPEGPVGTLTQIVPYDRPRFADIEGVGTVEIDYTGNMIGFSPVERCQHKGETTWIPTELCKNIRLQREPFVGAVHAAGLTGTASSGARLRRRTPTRVTKPAA